MELFAGVCELEETILDNDGVGLLETVFEFLTDFFGNRHYFLDVFLEMFGSINTGSGNERGRRFLMLFGHSVCLSVGLSVCMWMFTASFHGTIKTFQFFEIQSK